MSTIPMPGVNWVGASRILLDALRLAGVRLLLVSLSLATLALLEPSHRAADDEAVGVMRPAPGPLGSLVAPHPLRAPSLKGDVDGRVTDGMNGLPVAGAVVNLPDFGLTATTDEGGRFERLDVPLDDTAVPTTISVSADGYGEWTIEGVRILADETLILDVMLDAAPVRIVVPPPRAEEAIWPSADLASDLHAYEALSINQMDLPLPETIRVRVTDYPYCDTSRPYVVDTIDFKEYAKHVLPNEWVATWPWESLRAGAMAVKMYAWSYIAVGGKWSDADVYDSTCDQVYNPAVSYESTNQAVDFIWNWRLTRDGQLLRTFYRTYLSQCPEGILGSCMGQVESRDMAYDGDTWDEILAAFYDDGLLSPVVFPAGGYALRFYGNGYGDLDRVKIRIDEPANSDPGPAADIGQDDFTLEWWMKALPGEDSADSITCGENANWIYGNTLLDRDRYNADRKYGVSLAGGRVVFGVSGDGTGDLTICGSTQVDDDIWHHVAVERRRSDGWLWLFVDGRLEAEGDGPDGDISYPDDPFPGSFCGTGGDQPCTNSDPFLVVGARKYDIDSGLYPSYSGWIDELRISTILRYLEDFTPSDGPFELDGGAVAALYHLDEGVGNVIHDEFNGDGGPSDGVRKYGGIINGPEWIEDTPFVPPPAAQKPDTVGIRRGDRFDLQNSNTTGFADIRAVYGFSTDLPLVGDWDGDGVDTIGTFRSGVFYLRNSNSTGYADITFGYGLPGDIPIAGDWNGDGLDTIGVFRRGVFYLRNSNTTGYADITFGYGLPGDIPISGDWNGDGVDTPGVARNGVFYLRNSNSTGYADVTFGYGLPGDSPIAGDWDGDDVDNAGVFRGGVFYLRNSNTSGFADVTFGYGLPGDTPIAGDWDGLP